MEEEIAKKEAPLIKEAQEMLQKWEGGDKETVVATPAASSFRNDGNMGTASFVTGTFGFVAASRVVEMIVHGDAMALPTRGG